MSLRSHSLLEPRIVRHETQRGCSVRIARAVKYARVLRIGPGHRSALMTRAETSSPKRGNEFLFSVEPDKLGQRERESETERERERERRERERQRACVSVCPGFFFRGPPTEGRARLRRATGRREPRVWRAWRCKKGMARAGLEPGISGSGGRRLIVLRATQSG
jgi:hypothetical protein